MFNAMPWKTSLLQLNMIFKAVSEKDDIYWKRVSAVTHNRRVCPVFVHVIDYQINGIE